MSFFKMKLHFPILPMLCISIIIEKLINKVYVFARTTTTKKKNRLLKIVALLSVVNHFQTIFLPKRLPTF